MPRANRYFLPGMTYHLTHRCHDRSFLFRFALDRDAYRRVLWETKPKAAVHVLAYCITSNHMHLLVQARDSGSISSWMQRAEGEFAQWHNRRKERTGAFWEGRYHCTLIDGALHLERCMTYIELNMVRAGVVTHPRQWPWCSYGEWTGQRQRRRLVDIDPTLEHLGLQRLEDFRKHYEALVVEWIARGWLTRQGLWTESVAVGDAAFVAEVGSGIRWRRCFERQETDPGTWSLREDSEGVAYGQETGTKNACKALNQGAKHCYPPPAE